MRNFNDFIRVLGGIHSVLSGIASKIDLIPAGGSGGSSFDYSETPKVIGKFTDGETDVYQICASDTTPAGSTETSYSLTDLPDGMELDQILEATLSIDRGQYGFMEGSALYAIAIYSDHFTLQKITTASWGIESKPFYFTLRCTLKESA